MYKNIIIALLSLCLLCGAGWTTTPRWIDLKAEKTLIDRHEVIAAFETKAQFGDTYEERRVAKPEKCVQIIMTSGESLYTTKTTYEEVKAELLKDR